MSKPERPARRARRALNLSQERFAELLGTSYNVVQRWESGKTTPSAPIRALLEILEARPKVCLEILRPDETVSLPDPPPVAVPPPPSDQGDQPVAGRTPTASSGFTSLDASLPPPEPVDETKFSGDGGPPPGHAPPAQEGYDPDWGNLT